MGIYQWRDKKKPSGGKRRYYYKVKRKYAAGRPPTYTTLSAAEEEERKPVRARGGSYKIKAKKVAFAVVSNPKTGEARKARILRIVETPAHREYARRGIIVKGAVIDTTLGRAVVTSRPGQEGVVNAVLLEEQGQKQ
ncbi:30S ribosomal protein S8e [Aeropyrum pernix K1]|uniref:Small ribosomal subunit protein eS8 n=1 Tax=Aeropyrum pernix (strain ATCC 700893 / DSM 11879 / JCM 9820 / NBRC 100138 / K1) TaxID=272557 RepID=RS8E_AERPE|nr:30S ribosomal protein S8e [Aeropyrum pernix]Q9YDY0.1 RecName: Full=Small ribosomal subunit protein eS8; AltName: Full=30S ribosomal protein S8e [Aeropyrum pernix K1]BAA79767.1 30S ribosomal protein S8e [Aeropyrum pernix K1]